ncbi:uncharacterized protein CLUP02_10827 [Colletotrichum lupini]|uniref:Uncharacterized protein n=1 Tax=Colletotrichum lupini TaxID=145971 RepID=A0A9Q8SY95_9PEZI|nr:uncharacterized protein CLUP02_10827 [Colletotrichum lupini]UQC85330.1 hypothetical protein CLUP02_10827 [Colletotrichum lupini]
MLHSRLRLHDSDIGTYTELMWRSHCRTILRSFGAASRNGVIINVSIAKKPKQRREIDMLVRKSSVGLVLLVSGCLTLAFVLIRRVRDIRDEDHELQRPLCLANLTEATRKDKALRARGNTSYSAGRNNLKACCRHTRKNRILPLSFLLTLHA